MPPLEKFHKGHRAEIIGEYLLSHIAFTVPVVHRSDMGADLFCTLYEIDERQGDKTLSPMSTFAVQLKSSDSIVLSKFNIDYLRKLEIPFFIGKVDVDNQILSIFSFQQLLHLFQKYGGFKTSEDYEIELKLVENYSKDNVENNLFRLMDGYEQFENLLFDTQNDLVKPRKTKKGEIKRVKLEIGPEIIQIKADNITDAVREYSIEKLTEWVTLEYTNKYNDKTYVPFPILKYDNGEAIIIEYFNETNYGLNVYHHLSIRLAMLLLYFSNDDSLLREHRDLIIKSEDLVRFTLSKLDAETPYYKLLEKYLNKTIEKINDI